MDIEFVDFVYPVFIKGRPIESGQWPGAVKDIKADDKVQIWYSHDGTGVFITIGDDSTFVPSSNIKYAHTNNNPAF